MKLSSRVLRWMGLAAVIGALVFLAFHYREPLARWFSLEEPSESTEPQSTARPTTGPSAPELPELPATLDAELVAPLKKAQELVVQLGDALVRDSLPTAVQQAEALVAALDQAARGQPEPVLQTVRQAATHARELAAAPSLDEARRLLGDINRVLFHLGAHSEDLRAGLHVFKCPMAPGFQLWFQKAPSIANPYMGTAMPTCGVRSEWPVHGQGAPEPEAPDASAQEIAYWTCSMHPSVKSDKKATCPICSMDLTPVTVQERDQGLLFIDEHRRQLINLRTTTVRKEQLVVSVRGYADVTVADPQRKAVNLRVAGWIETLHADKPGQPIQAGESLFTLYSPELYSAQEEFLTALDGRSAELAKRARERLRLFSLTPRQIEDIVERKSPSSTIDILAPRDGFLLEKHVIEGDRVPAGRTVMEIAGLDPVWVDLELFESSVPLLKTGMKVDLELSNLPGVRLEAAVDYVYPTLDDRRRSVRVRLVAKNLRPGMHALGLLEVDLGERLLVPRDAVVYTGSRRLVFLDVGEGRLLPKELSIGHGTPTHLEVRDGLNAGDKVVSSATFLIASESRIRSAETIWRSGDGR
ncbi:MAG: efflux RND transporter periplasmic adaptor subunit [Planctomycetota bacterium]